MLQENDNPAFRVLRGGAALLAVLLFSAPAAAQVGQNAENGKAGEEVVADDEKLPFDRAIGRGYEAETLKFGEGEIRGMVAEPGPREGVPGLPLGNMNVTLVNAMTGVRIAETATDALGQFNLGRNFMKGQYLVTIGRGYVQGKIVVEEGAKNEPFTVYVPNDVAMGWKPVMITPKGEFSDVNNFNTGVGQFRGVLTNEDGSEGVPDMPVRLLHPDDGTTLVRTTTDKDGYFDLGNVDEGSFILAVGQATLFTHTHHEGGKVIQFLQISSNLDYLKAGYVGSIYFSEPALVIIPPPPVGLIVGTAAVVATSVAVPVGVGVPGGGGDDPGGGPPREEPPPVTGEGVTPGPPVEEPPEEF